MHHSNIYLQDMRKSLRNCSERSQKAEYSTIQWKIIQQVGFNSDTAESQFITINKLVKLCASSGLSSLAPPGSFPVSDLVTCDLPVLAIKRRGLPPKHDALTGENHKMSQIKLNNMLNTCASLRIRVCSCKGDLAV